MPRLMLTLHPQLLQAIDHAKRYDESRASYIRECIRQRIEREQEEQEAELLDI